MDIRYMNHFNKYPSPITDKEIVYLSSLSDSEIRKDRRELLEFLGDLEDWDEMEWGYDPLEQNFDEANDFNFRVNKILHQFMGFDERIAKDFFFRRFRTIEKFVEYNDELGTEETKFNFDINLWGVFSIDNLDPVMFEQLGKLIDIDAIRKFEIHAKSLTGSINSNFFVHTPAIERIQIDIEEPIKIPVGIFKNTTSIYEIKIGNVTVLPSDSFKYTPKLTKVHICGECKIGSNIFKYTPLLQDISMQDVHGISNYLLDGLKVISVNFYVCKFNSVPPLNQFGGNSKLKRIQIIGCEFPRFLNSNNEQKGSFLNDFINNNTFSNLTDLEIYGNKPSIMAYNELHPLLTSSSKGIRLEIILDEDIAISTHMSFPGVKELVIKITNEHTTFDFLRNFLSLFPEIRKLKILGKRSSIGNLIIQDDLIDICPKLERLTRPTYY